jgi:hypothetical protein
MFALSPAMKAFFLKKWGLKSNFVQVYGNQQYSWNGDNCGRGPGSLGSPAIPISVL